MAIVTGTNSTDVIGYLQGVTDYSDTIYGLGGNDFIFGYGGNDRIFGGQGADHINGGGGINTAAYWDSSAGVTVNLILGEGEGGDAEGDQLVNIQHVEGSDHGDTLTGDNGANDLYGRDGNDLIRGGYGADYINGGAGIDTAYYWETNAGVSINLSTGEGSGGSAEGDELVSIENVEASSYDDTLIGNSAGNKLAGNGGDDVLKGGGGNDVLSGGEGADHMEGGSGTDTARYWGSHSAVIVSLETGTGSGGDANGDTLYSIENLEGSSYDDILIGNDATNVLYGHNGHDTLKGGGGSDSLYGGDGNDTLKGGGGADTLRGENGIDTAAYNESTVAVIASLVTGGSAGDAAGDTYYDIENLTGSGYGDTLQGNSGINVLRGLDGNDALSGMQGYDTLWGGNGDDTLDGGTGNDTLYGENNDDSLNGGVGADTMVGGLGNDDYFVDNASDVVTESGGNGSDDVYVSVSYTLTAGADVERLMTTSDSGTSAIDLTGNNSTQQITGNAGANFINGRESGDTLSGLGGDDVFVFDTALGASNVDTIMDFDPAAEFIYIDNAVFSNLGAEPGHFVPSNEFRAGTAAVDADDRIIHDSSTGAIFYDSDGTGAAAQVQFAWVDPGLTLAHDNFHIF